MKRIYQQVCVRGVSHGTEGFAVMLDDRPVRTPAKHTLVLPTRRLAEASAAEWRAQEAEVRPAAMPLTRMACTAIDLVETGRRRAAIDDIARYGECDLLCYRASDQAELFERQQRLWQPAVDWIGARHGLAFRVTSGIVPIPQSTEMLAALRDLIRSYDDYRLVGLHSATLSTGSVILGLGLADAHLDAETAWTLSQLDESYQIEKWGLDAEAETRRANLRAELEVVAKWLLLMPG